MKPICRYIKPHINTFTATLSCKIHQTIIFDYMPQLFLFLLLIVGHNILADPNARSLWFAEAGWQTGKLFRMHPGQPVSGLSQGAALTIGIQTRGAQPWHKPMGYPRLGLSFSVTDGGNDKVFGRQYALVPVIFFTPGKKPRGPAGFEMLLGLGAGFYDRPYHPETNPDNQLYAGKAIWHFQLGFGLTAALRQNMSMQAGMIWTHGSSGHTQLPSVGWNVFAARLSFRGLFSRKVTTYHHDSTYVTDKKLRFGFRVGAGWMQRGDAFTDQTPGKMYYVLNGSFFISRRLGKIWKLQTGIIYRYYQNYARAIRDWQIPVRSSFLQSSALIGYVGNEFQFGRFAFHVDVGANLYKPFFREYFNRVEKGSNITFWTQQILITRIGGAFYLLDPYKHPSHNVFIHAHVNANVGQAEFTELGIGYVF